MTLFRQFVTLLGSGCYLRKLGEFLAIDVFHGYHATVMLLILVWSTAYRL